MTAFDFQGRVIVGPANAAAGIRTVVLPRSIIEQLVEHFARLHETASKAWLFPALEGGPIHRTAWMCRVWKPALAAARLDQDLGTHTLRRSQVALLIPQGAHPKVIADRLGHASVRASSTCTVTCTWVSTRRKRKASMPKACCLPLLRQRRGKCASCRRDVVVAAAKRICLLPSPPRPGRAPARRLALREGASS